MTTTAVGPLPEAASRLRVRGQPGAVSAALAVVRPEWSQSVLLVGPAGVGKTTLALDLAAVLLCEAAPEERPCRACRGCRKVASGNHPDVHRVAPDGPGGQIRIGARTDPDAGTVRRLIGDLALMPVEGGARVAIVEHADRMNEDAQSALLKTLEEPPTGTTILLCADEEERLVPTIRSRCARIRLGPLGVRAVEELLDEIGGVDAPTAGRLGRLAGGRPGAALAYAAAPEAVVARTEMARQLLDLLSATRAARLAAAKSLLATASQAAAALARAGVPAPARPGRSRARGADAAAPPSPGPSAAAPAGGDADPDAPTDSAEAGTTGLRRAAPAERRRAALLLVEAWRVVARDLALVQLGATSSVRDVSLIDDLDEAAPSLRPGAAAAFLARLDRAGELLESNVSPELVVDALVLAWPAAPVRP